jgi:hypothetical protein
LKLQLFASQQIDQLKASPLTRNLQNSWKKSIRPFAKFWRISVKQLEEALSV